MINPFNLGVYRWLNTINGKSYIGSSAYIAGRKSFHLSQLRAGKHHSIKFQRAWNKYGPSAFEFEVLTFCLKNDLLWQEQIAIDGFNAVKNGYNVLPLAGRTSGHVLSDETKKRQSKASTIKWQDAEFRDKMHQAQMASWSDGRRKLQGQRATMYNKRREYPIDIKTRMSSISKAAWGDPIFRKKQQDNWTDTRRKSQADRMRNVRVLSPAIHSKCKPYQSIIVEMVKDGIKATDIWRELVSNHGLQVTSSTMVGFVRGLRGTKIQVEHNRVWNNYIAHPQLCEKCKCPIIPRRRDLSTITDKK